LITYFSKKNAFNLVLLFLYTVVLKSSFFTHPQAALLNNGDGKAYEVFLHLLKNTGSYYTFWCSIIAFGLFYLQALLLSVMLAKSKMFVRPNYLAGMAYILITSFFQNMNVLNSALICNTFILLFVNLLIQIYHTPKPKATLFNIGLILCICNLFYSFSFPFLLLGIIGVLTYRAFKLNEYFIFLLGYITPYYCLIAYQYIKGNFSIANFKLTVHYMLPKFQNNQVGFLSTMIIISLVLFGFMKIQAETGRMNIQSRKSWSILFWGLLISIFIPCLGADFHYWVVCLPFDAAFIAAVFYFTKKTKWVSYLHWILFGYAIFINYFLVKV
jgi:hypothetical protein